MATKGGTERTISAARAILLLAIGEAKAEAIAAALEGPVSAACPASVLQRHPRCTVILDRAAAARRGLTCNQSFAGHYDFRGDYAALFPAFLRQPGEAHLVMCHPGAGERVGDVIAAARPVEAQALRRLPLAQLATDRGLTFPT